MSQDEEHRRHVSEWQLLADTTHAIARDVNSEVHALLDHIRRERGVLLERAGQLGQEELENPRAREYERMAGELKLAEESIRKVFPRLVELRRR